MAHQKTKVIIIGAGVFGLSCAYALLRDGFSVDIYDALGVGQGASGGIVGALSPHTPDQWNAKKQFQYDALRDNQAFWAQVDDLSGYDSGYGRIGRIIPIQTARDLALAQARVSSAQTNWQGQFDYKVIATPDIMAANSAPYGVIHETLSARLYPAHAMASLGAACQKLGAVFHCNHPVAKISDHRINGPWGKATADAIIVAAGVGGFALLNPHLGVRSGQGVKGQAALLHMRSKFDLPQIYADGLYIIPHSNGMIAIGSTSENSWDHATRTDTQLDDLVARAIGIVPALAQAKIMQRWAELRPKARKRDPMLGKLPGLTGVYAALGGFKIGIGIAPKIGTVMRDFIAQNPVDIPPTFRVDHHLGQ